jgi:monofunctional biosynthetic peptidoglycan transglycosylase
LARAFALILVALFVVVAILLIAYRWVDPPFTTLTLAQRVSGTAITQRWVPIRRISPHLQKAVLLSEDGRFCSHGGVDWQALEAAIEDAQDGVARGASTISMQVVKNLFLWPSRSYLRKGLEIGLATVADGLWSKERTLEIYLNIAEWGPGIFGAEAAARAHFGKAASQLTEREAVLLAVALPSPLTRDPGAPTSTQLRLAQRLDRRMRGPHPALRCIETLAQAS